MGIVIRCNLHFVVFSHTQGVPGSCSASCHAPAAERESLEKWTVTMQTDRQTNKQTDTIQVAQTAGPLLLGFDACVHSFHWIQRLQSADFPAV